MNPTVSVVIGTYNRHHLIATTIESILVQSRQVLEIVVIDDGSTDGTGDWMRSHYPQVRTITYPNGGTSRTRNRGADQAHGDILIFLDHDDVLLPQAVETLVSLLEQFPSARAAFADHELKNVVDGEHFRNHHTEQPAFHRMRAVPALERHGDDRMYGRDLRFALLYGNLLQQPWAIYRADFLALGGFDPAIRYCEDWDLYMRVTGRFPVAMTDRVVSIHFIEGSNLHRMDGQDIQHMKVLRKHIGLCAWGDVRALVVLRRRLANYHKTHGDHRRAAGEAGAWTAYLYALATWPFEPIVAVRCLAWMPRGVLEALRGRRRGPSR